MRYWRYSNYFDPLEVTPAFPDTTDMALRFDWGPRNQENTVKLAKVFLLGFFIGEFFLLSLFGAVALGV